MTSNLASESKYEFVLVLSGIDDITTELEDRLYESGCDDATLSFQAGRTTLQFARAADSLAAAVDSAVRDVHAAGITVAAVESEHPVGPVSGG